MDVINGWKAVTSGDTNDILNKNWVGGGGAGAGLKPIWENIRDSEVTMRPAVLVAISSELCRM